MKQHVFIVSGLHKIREADAEIVVCAKRTWAELPGGRRCLLGSTAFFTRAAAERVKLAHLQKLAATRALHFLAPTIIASAQQQLDLFRRNGRLN